MTLSTSSSTQPPLNRLADVAQRGSPSALLRRGLVGVVGVLICLAPLLLAQHASAQRAAACSTPSSDAVLAERALVRAGFEGVYVCVENGEAVVHYEDRVYRYAVEGMRAVRETVESFLGADVVTVALVPHRLGLPLGTYRFPRRQLGMLGAVEPLLGVRPRPTAGAVRNPNRFKLDAVLHPELEALFGNFDEAVQLRVGLAPALSVSLWPGMDLTGQLVFSIVNEIDDASPLQPGILAVSQSARLPYATFATLTAGYFTNNRYGLDARVQTFALNGRLHATARVGRTGFATYQDQTWFYGPLDVTTAHLDVGAVLLPQYALTAEVGYGQYLLGDRSFTFGLHRRFGEVQMGFRGLAGGDDLNVEARIVLPLPIAEHARPGRIRARTADRFPWAYRYRRLTRIGESYETAPGAPEWLGPLNPAVFRHLLQREVDADQEALESARRGG